ncbi:MAG TPA: glutathione S-transferase [Polyangiaceae bacterium]|jgi:glutathione S-transferase
MEKLTLYGTPLSHFTRKVRILLLELGIPFDAIRPPDLLATTPSAYGANPLMRVPTLVHAGKTIIDSDHIARYLVSAFDAGDRFGVMSADPRAMNRLAVANGIMAHEVTLILAERGGVENLHGAPYFRKLREAIDAGLTWLAAGAELDAPGFSYADIATVAMWQHVEHYASAPDLGRFEGIAARVARFAARPSVAATTPAASVATAAEWEARAGRA